MIRLRPIRVACLAALSMLAGSLGAGPATAAPSPRTVSTRLSIVGAVFDHGAGEDVTLTGELHLLTRVSDGLTDWHLNAGHISGTGATTGEPYLLAGTDAGSVQFPPGPPVRTVLIEPTLTLLPPGPPTHPPSPIRLLVAVSVGAGGQVTGVDVHLDTAPPTLDVAR